MSQRNHPKLDHQIRALLNSDTYKEKKPRNFLENSQNILKILNILLNFLSGKIGSTHLSPLKISANLICASGKMKTDGHAKHNFSNDFGKSKIHSKSDLERKSQCGISKLLMSSRD